jgi:hypothetical protein
VSAGRGEPALPRGEGFNLSAVVLRRPQLTAFFLLLVAIAGTLAFFRSASARIPTSRSARW